LTFAPSSFRDPDSRVLALDGTRVVRALSARAAAVDLALRRGGQLAALERDGLLIASEPCDDVAVPEGWAALIQSPRLPFVSYPYEWSFGMLQDAALLTLRLTERLLADAVLVKDASAYNVLFAGVAPRFIDLGSFAAYEAQAPWAAYGQFGDHFLAPLMLEAFKGVAFQPFLRGNLEGMSVTDQLAPLLSVADLRRPGVLLHVKARALLDRRGRALSTADRRAVRHAALPKEALLRNLRGLQRVVTRLRSTAPSVWASYDEANSYEAAALAQKTAFVAAAAERLGGGALAWDVGANTGRYSRVLARRYATVVAMDADAGAVDRLYRSLQTDPASGQILPLVVDVMDPSPPRGWRGRERAGLQERGQPDLAVYLAIMHHVCLGCGVPLADFVDFVCATSPAAVVEFVGADDPMSQTILATKAVTHGGYDLASFRDLVTRRARILAVEAVSATRHLFLLSR
jgi:hypothetical protein